MKKKLFAMVLMVVCFSLVAIPEEAGVQIQKERTSLFTCSNTGGTCPITIERDSQ
jgi:hypothetical protein